MENGQNCLRVFLLEYLKKRYGITSAVKHFAEKLLEQLEKGGICLELSGDEKTALQNENSAAIGKPGDIRPLILDGERLYVQRYFEYQKIILEKIEILLEKGKIHIITGGPGTGKTTSLAQILAGKSDEKILLAAPTGKAALRMQESLAAQNINLQAKTLHRLMGYIPNRVNFRHTKENPLEADIIAIDECSMIDLPLTAKFLDALPNDCELYLLGDKNQLASVEAGSVFADICRKLERKFGASHDGFQSENNRAYTEKTKNYRAQNAPGIADLSKRILEGNAESLDNENVAFSENFDFNADFFKDLFEAKNETEALKSLKKFQILCATKVGKNGCARVNEKFAALSKKHNARYTPIIITQNNYTMNLFNGDAGVRDEKKQTAYFENRQEAIPVSILPEFEPAFAITIHKSQGSEYDRVAVLYPDKESDTEFLTKELLYTAVTRAKKECLIFGEKQTLINSCKRKISRASGIE